MKRVSFVLAACAVQVLVFAGVALAHVEISPNEVPPGGTQEFAAEVPNESDVPFTEVRVEVPDGFEVTDVGSPAGWQGALEDGAVVWSGGEVPAGESAGFAFEARAPQQEGEFAWKSFQTYEDGEVSEWTGPADSERPAPVVRVTSGGVSGGTDEPQHGDEGHGAGAHSETTEPMPVTGGVSAGALALGGLLLAAGWIVGSRRNA